MGLLSSIGIFGLALGVLGAASANEAVPKSAATVRLKAIDLLGQVHRVGEGERTKAVALVFLSQECPISNQYVSELNRIAKAQPEGQVEFFGVISDRGTTRAKAAEFAKSFGVQFPILFDATGEIAERFAPTHVPQAFVLNREGEIVYQGRIDNLYASLGKRRPRATEQDLVDALAAVLKGATPAVKQSEIVGCKLETAKLKADPRSITFHRDVAPILYANCIHCHRPGEVAPFSLISYDDVAKRASFIAEITSQRRMPPWKLRPDFGHFLSDRRLSDQELATLRAWAELGAPEGDPEDQPPLPKFAEGWQLGTPDLVLKMAEPYKVAATGPDAFRFFVIPIDIPEDKVVTAVEFRPGNPRIVHHAIMYIDRSGMARKRDEATPEPGYEGFLTGGIRPQGVLGFWAPGYTPRYLPEGVGMTVRTKSDVALQMHYHPSGKEETDQSEIGVYYAKKPVQHELGGLALINFAVNIPPGEKRHNMRFSFTSPVELELAEVVPHMHLIGTEMKVTATQPDGKVVPLVWIDWDFNWQDQFRYADPIRLPAGTRFDLEAYFDNSADNPYNPSSPPKRVVFGEMTTDEMCICAFRTIESLSQEKRRLLKAALEKSMEEQLKNPLVAINITRFLLAGEGSLPKSKNNPKPQTEEPNADAGKGK